MKNGLIRCFPNRPSPGKKECTRKPSPTIWAGGGVRIRSMLLIAIVKIYAGTDSFVSRLQSHKNSSRKTSRLSPASRNSNKILTGTRVPTNTGIPPRMSGSLCTTWATRCCIGGTSYLSPYGNPARDVPRSWRTCVRQAIHGHGLGHVAGTQASSSLQTRSQSSSLQG